MLNITDCLILCSKQDLTSKFTVIHDVWKTRGNRYGFITASVTYINTSWKYVVQHLTLKCIPWHHKGIWLAQPLANVFMKHGLSHKISVWFLMRIKLSMNFNA